MESFNNKLRIVLLISLGALGTYGVMTHRQPKEPVKTEQTENNNQASDIEKDQQEDISDNSL